MANQINSSAGVYFQVIDESQVPLSQSQVAVGAISFFSKQGPVDQIVKITGGPNQFINLFGLPDASVSYAHHQALVALTQMNTLLCTRVHNNALFGGLTACIETVTVLPADPLNPPAVPETIKQFSFKKWTSGKMVDPNNHNTFYSKSDPDFTDASDLFYIYGVDPNSFTSNYRVSVSDIKDSTDKSNPNTFKIKVFSAKGTSPIETWLVSLTKQTDGYGRQQFMEKVINGESRYIRVLVNTNFNTISGLKVIKAANITASSVVDYYGTTLTDKAILHNGDSGLTDGQGGTIDASTVSTIINGQDAFPAAIADAPSATKNSGWQLYIDREEVDFDLLINGGYTSQVVHQKMLEIADTRGDCFAILDIPVDMQGSKYDPTTAPIEYRDNILNANTPNGALYTPWYEVNDPYSGQTISIPPAGHLAAIYCFTDTNYATWFSPAGLNRGIIERIDGNFVQADMVYNQAARNHLNDYQINFTRYLSNIGTAIWNDSTLQSVESAESYISVVRLLKFCIKNINRALLYDVFEPNDATLRAKIKGTLSNILEPISNARGLYKYEIVCSGPDDANSNNTNLNIAQGILNVDVYLWPTIPAKRIMVRLYVERSGAVIGTVSSN